MNAILEEASRASHAPNREALAGAASPASTQEGARSIRSSWWAPRLTVFATAAVFLVAALTLTAIGISGGLRQLTSDGAAESTAADKVAPATDDGATLGESQPESEDSTAMSAPVAETPAYITVDGLVYVPAGRTEVDESRLTTVGPVDGRSAEGTTAPLYSYSSGTGDGGIVVAEGGAWTAYEPVTRRFAGNVYQLASGTDITRAGQWPDLPTAYPVPSAADGSPTFRFFGYDESGIAVYIPAGGTEQDGFAIAPGTSPDDPAAGNPGWTWWVPAP